MRLSNARKVLQHVLDGKLHGNPRSRIASAYQIFKVLVLTDELVLHGVPHHLVELMREKKGDFFFFGGDTEYTTGDQPGNFIS